MRFPAYVFLPILGVAVLTAAMLGSWLMPAPDAPALDLGPAPVATPVATEPPPVPAPLPPPSMPVRPRPVAARPAPEPVPPPRPTPTPAPMPSEPVAIEPGPTMVPPSSQITNLSPELRANVQQKWSTIRTRAADLVRRGVEQLERQRDEARARGDQAEAERLDTVIRTQKERLELMHGKRPEGAQIDPALAPQGMPPPVQAGPPVQ